jgi:chromosome segregation ATPase
MLDGLKNLTGGKGKTQQQASELERLIATAREERGAVSAVLDTLTSRSARLAPLALSLEQVGDRTAAVAAKLDEIGARLNGLDERTRSFEDVAKRIEALTSAAQQAELTTQKAIGPDGELRKHREAVQQVSSQALQTQATLDTLKKERASLEELRTEVRAAFKEVEQSANTFTTLKGELGQVRSMVTGVTQDFTRIRETSREARNDSTAAMATAKDIEKKFVPLAQIDELSRNTEERLASLNALSEHVTRKAKVLDTQQQAVEHAIVQANRVTEMVWGMDIQIGKLNEGLKQTATAEETIGRMEKLSDAAVQRMEAAIKFSEDLKRETTRMEKDGSALLDAVRTEVGGLAVRKKELEAFDERLRGLQTGISEAQGRIDTIAAKDKNLVTLTQQIDGLGKRFDTLFAQSDEITKKQLALETLHERLGQVDELAKRTAWQMDAHRQSRQDLDAFRKEIQEFYKSHADITVLRDKLGADRVAYETSAQGLAAFATHAPALEAKIEAILAQMGVVEEGTQKATRLNEAVAELDAHITRMSARVPLIEKLEERLNGLNAVSSEVDQKLATQLARRAELDTLKVACDDLAAQMNAQQNFEESARVPVVAEFNALRTQIATAQDRIGSVKYDAETIIEQERRFAELVAASEGVAAEVAQRTHQMQTLSEELGRSTSLKDELLGELHLVHSRQHDAASQVQATEDQLARTEQIFKQLEQRRTQLAFSEKKMSALEVRLTEVHQVADELDKTVTAIADREQLVHAVKAEIESVHEISARNRDDLAHISEHRTEVTTLKKNVDKLLSQIADTDGRIVAIDGHRKLVNEVQAKANAIVHLLGDVRINLETLSEQKVVVDHVAEQVAQLKFMLQEARNATRSLQHERELAERIEQSVKELRARTAPAADGGKKIA